MPVARAPRMQFGECVWGENRLPCAFVRQTNWSMSASRTSNRASPLSAPCPFDTPSRGCVYDFLARRRVAIGAVPPPSSAASSPTGGASVRASIVLMHAPRRTTIHAHDRLRENNRAKQGVPPCRHPAFEITQPPALPWFSMCHWPSSRRRVRRDRRSLTRPRGRCSQSRASTLS